MEKENKKQNNNIAVIVILALLLIAVLAFGIWAWSKYITTLSGSASATVAKWKFGQTTETTLDLGTASQDSIIDYTNNNVKAERIAPGTKGHFNIGFDTDSTEVALTYKIELLNVTNKPANLHFYSDADCNNELTGTDKTGYTLEGSLSATDAESFNGKVIPIYWRWEYNDPTGDTQTPNSADVTDQGKAVSFTLKVTGTQADPTKEKIQTNTTAVNAADVRK